MKPRLVLFGVIGLVLFGALGAFLLSRGVIWPVYPDRDQYPLRGIDVSHHQGEIDWNQVAHDDVAFAFLKATEGDDFKDPRFQENWVKAQENGIVVGAYHFYSLRFPGEVQAQNFIATVPRQEGTLPPVVDLEYGGNSKVRPPKDEFQKNLLTYLDLIRNQYEREPILYVTYEFYEDYLKPEFKDDPIWIRDLFSKPDTDLVGDWLFWQYKNRGHIEGIEGFVDLNVFNGDLDDFRSLTE